MNASSVADALVTAAAVVTATTVLVGTGWWLIGPRVRQWLAACVETATAAALERIEIRLARVEAGQRAAHTPDQLLDLAELLQLVREHRPPPP